MKSIIKIMSIIAVGTYMLCSCEGFIPETRVDLDTVEDIANSNYNNLYQQGIHVYHYLPNGYGRIGNAMLAAATDEADYAVPGSTIEYLQNGTWNPVTNPDDKWDNCYYGIKRARQFLKNSEGYEDIILRDTSTTSSKQNYLDQCADLKCLRAENKAMIGLIYFELLKRYGGVPIVNKEYTLESAPDMVRNSYDEVVNYIVTNIDEALPDLKESWQAYKPADFGRLEIGSALAIKARVLLYAASPAYNLTGDPLKWEKAAAAAREVIELGRYRLAADYGTMFLGLNGHQNPETILCYMTGENNTMESLNYPISTNGGKTGTCPSANLVDAYEFADGTPFDWTKVAPGEDPYAGRDPRLQKTVVVNGSTWNGRTMEIYEGGKEGLDVVKATTTGYYLKKFLTDGLDLELGHTAVHSWPIIRYADVLLMYAEAMNEAYGPDVDFYNDGHTARWAVNQIRTRAGMPDVVAYTQAEMRARICHERRVELAFEEHRYWDARRWGQETAAAVLGAPLMGVKITQNGTGFDYENFTVENRVYEAKMLYYPIPQSETLETDGLISQNPGW